MIVMQCLTQKDMVVSKFIKYREARIINVKRSSDSFQEKTIIARVETYYKLFCLMNACKCIKKKSKT